MQDDYFFWSTYNHIYWLKKFADISLKVIGLCIIKLRSIFPSNLTINHNLSLDMAYQYYYYVLILV